MFYVMCPELPLDRGQPRTPEYFWPDDANLGEVVAQDAGID